MRKGHSIRYLIALSSLFLTTTNMRSPALAQFGFFRSNEAPACDDSQARSLLTAPPSQKDLMNYQSTTSSYSLNPLLCGHTIRHEGGQWNVINEHITHIKSEAKKYREFKAYDSGTKKRFCETDIVDEYLVTARRIGLDQPVPTGKSVPGYPHLQIFDPKPNAIQKSLDQLKEACSVQRTIRYSIQKTSDEPLIQIFY